MTEPGGVVVDTSVLIDHLHGDRRAYDLLSAAFAADVPILGSVLTRTEILAGLRAGEQRATARLLDTIEWVSVDSEVADRAGEFAARYLRSHPGVDVVDYVIAATAALAGAELLTRNVRHFPMFPGLTAPY